MLSRFNVMPVRDKKPLISWKHLTEETQTLQEREKIISENKEGNIGVICGPVSKLFILDDDGSEELKKYHLPRTATVRTPRGGRHHYFKWVADLDNKITTRTAVLDKVDTRGHGGFCVFYGWEKAPNIIPFANPPQWLIDKLPNKTGTTVIGKPSAVEIITNIKDGNRNASFASLAGGLRRNGYSAEAIFEFLKPKAQQVGFAEGELWLVCRSIARYEPAVISDQGVSVDSFLADQQKVEWICEPFLARQAIGFIAGLPESRKSFLLFDLAISCASGQPWVSKFETKQCKVLVIDQERSKAEMQRRFTAILKSKDLNSKALKDTLFLRCGTSTRIDIQASYDSLRKEIADIKPDIVLIDSFATFHTKNESSRMEIQQVLERIKAIRNEFKCAIVFINHETKQSFQNRKEGEASSYLDMAGNVAIPAAAEFCMSIVKHDDETSFCHHTKSTLGSKAAPFLIRVIDVPEGGIDVRAL